MHTANSPSVVAPVDGVYLITGSVIFQGGTAVGELQLSVDNTKPIADSQDDARTSAIEVQDVATSLG